MNHVLICGAGSVGIAVGASLCSQGIDVCFLAREKTRQAILSGGISRTGLFGEIRIPAEKKSAEANMADSEPDTQLLPPVDSITGSASDGQFPVPDGCVTGSGSAGQSLVPIDSVSGSGPAWQAPAPVGCVSATSTLSSLADGWADYILVCTKTLANEEIAALLWENRRKFSAGFTIVIMQNGWGMDTLYLNYFEKSQLYQARIITGFERTAPNSSNITVHTAPILFGSLYGCSTDRVQPLAAAICASGIPSETTEDLSAALWAKMLYNTTLNPLGAILGVPYGRLTEIPESRRIMDRLIDETFLVLDACGYRTFWNSPEEYREVFYGKLVPDTYAHRSSTLQDMEKKKKTEIDTLNGCVVRLAEEHGLDVPTHRMICELIRALEADSGT